MKRHGATVLRYVAYTFIIGFAIALFWPITACACSRAAPASVCLSNLKQISLGSIMYANDFDDRFPHRDRWMDETKDYVKVEDIFHEPVLQKPKADKRIYGYAFNGALSQAKAPGDPATVPLNYDSVNLIRNASDLVTSLPAAGRHGGKNNIVYADGHAKRVAVVP